MKKILVLLLVVVFVVGLAACTGTQEAASSESASTETEAVASEAASDVAGEPFKVAYLVADLENPFWKATDDGFEDMALSLGMEPKAFNSSGDAATQMQNAQDIVTLGYDAVVIAGTDSSSATSAVQEFNDADIPVWILHIAPDSDTVHFEGMVDAKNEEGCYNAGIAMADMYADRGFTGKAAEITISLARSNGAARHKGFEQAMNEKGIDLAFVKEAVDYTREESYKFTQDLLTANDDISILYCNYDEAVLGAMKAVEDSGRKDVIVLGGFDGSPESIGAVKDGEIDLMAIQPAYHHGELIAEQMNAYLVDGTPGEKVSTECPLVTVDNVATEGDKVMGMLYGPEA